MLAGGIIITAMSDRVFMAEPATTATRVTALHNYFEQNVVRGGEFICGAAEMCKASHAGDFHESQLHHVGNSYDLLLDERPLRIVVVGQEYGHGPPLVGLAARHN